MDFVRS